MKVGGILGMSRCWAGIITVLALAAGASKADATVLFSNSAEGLSASASFTISGSAGVRQLTVLLTNTDTAIDLSPSAAEAPAVTGLFFNLGTAFFPPLVSTPKAYAMNSIQAAPSVLDGWTAGGRNTLDGAALIDGAVKFVFDIPEGLAETDIKNVGFTVGSGENTKTLAGSAGATPSSVSKVESTIPEPAVLSLLGLAMAGLGYRLRRKAR